MGTGYTSFPVAQDTALPNNYFYIRDPADSTNEIVLVYSGGSSSATWSVQRGMNGSTVAHATGATWVQVIAPYTLSNFKQAVGADITSVVLSDSTTETVICSYQPYTGEITPGATYEIDASGGLSTSSSAPTLQWTIRWGGVSGTILCQLLTGSSTTTIAATAMATSIGAGSGFDVNGTVTFESTTQATANLNFFWKKTTTAYTAVASSMTPVTISGTGPLVLTAKWGTANASNALTVPAPLTYRAS